MAKFVVDRRTWYRGNGSANSRLLTKSGQRCCIGFVGQQCGVADETLLDVGAVALFPEETISKFPNWMRFDNGDVQQAYTLNDDYTDEEDSTDEDDDEATKTVPMTEALREAKLQALFARYGDEIVFEN